MEYKISSVGFFSRDTYGRDGNHRVMVKFEGEDKEYSAFVPSKPNVGDTWDGELKKAEKDDKIYWNFEFSKKKNSAPSSTGFTEFDREMIKGIFNNVNAIRKHLIFGPEPKIEGSADDMPF